MQTDIDIHYRQIKYTQSIYVQNQKSKQYSATEKPDLGVVMWTLKCNKTKHICKQQCQFHLTSYTEDFLKFHGVWDRSTLLEFL